MHLLNTQMNIELKKNTMTQRMHKVHKGFVYLEGFCVILV